ncbi:hypothetical protein LTR78_001297 [Recurvomyces mirabilis]|uniref:Enoyl reductase (ER) domain-containing protein n=1 Tax=Recurvomyces mirabilis TaxID=574656 RepID=A0AAE0WVY0_9PEZI|nr:hypothetical protein LTR78_001297 [Recurvomyces mirabilis]KAK5161274.1 hypothetical protein LTS14_001070 [Recurvomyces mirabilis]
MSSNQSAFVDGKDLPLRIAASSIPEPGPNDIIVKNHAVAVNTIDPAQASGFNVKKFPTVLGMDLAGEVHEVGSSVTKFKKGDRVIGHAWQFTTGAWEDGAFSLYPRIPAANAAILPSDIAFTVGVVLPLAIDTAAGGLYQPGYMGLDFPNIDTQPNSKGEVVVVYGGSTSVGAAAIQLAVAAGYRAIVTCSPENFDLCRECGASDIFDYKSPTIANDIAAAVGADKFKGLYNAIGIPESFKVVTPIVEKLGGGFVANTKPPPQDLPASVTVKFVLGVNEFVFPVWKDFVTKGLQSGKLQCLPKPTIVGKGLESLQKAFEVRNGDVRATKVVVEL